MKQILGYLFKKNRPEAVSGGKEKGVVSNFEYNRELWNRYSKNWDKKKVTVQNKEIQDAEREEYLKYLGNEWGRVQDVETIVSEFIFPYVDKNSTVAEIGSGGGRVALKVIDRVKELTCFDISTEMLNRVQEVLHPYQNARFVLMNNPTFDSIYTNQFDFVYSFDVFLHLDLHMIWKYFLEIRSVLKKNGKVFLHTTNLRTKNGWAKFAKQKAYSVEGNFFISPEVIEIFSEKSGFNIIKRSEPTGNNYYYDRDFLFVLQK